MMPKLSIITVTRTRPHLLLNAIESLRSQTCQDFEWIVVNDGVDIATRNLVHNHPLLFYTYLEMAHPAKGFGLSIGRNRGLVVAEGEIVTYLDDDNTFKPSFVKETIAFFDNHLQMNYSMPIQQRRREVLRDGVVVKRGKEFFSPTPDCKVDELITHQQLVDSNGFAHRSIASIKDLSWNPDLRIYIDYEFFLKCASYWRRESFGLNPAVLVDYVQTNQGVIGSSTYQEWAKELEWTIEQKRYYSCLLESDLEALERLAFKYRFHRPESENISAFIA
jgi:glycosyltransferase involved in cell wall biosynthesis